MTYEQYIELEDLYRESQLGYDFIHTDLINQNLFAVTLSDENIELSDALEAFQAEESGTFYPGIIMVPAHTVIRTGDFEFAKSLIQTIKAFKKTSK